MEKYCGDAICAMQTDYQTLAKAAIASAALPQIWDIMSTALGPITKFREIMW